MPIEVQSECRRVSKEEFARVAYEAMGVFFDVHRDMGRLFAEQIYKREVAQRHGRIELEVPIDVTFDGFHKRYWIDMLVCGCTIFEVKVGRALAADHRAQLMNYLLLAGLSRGKLVNVRPASIEHEFVNALASVSDRTSFEVDDRNWLPASDRDAFWKEWLTGAIRDWGVDLEVSLYTEAIVHVLGGLENVERQIEVVMGERVIGPQNVLLTGPSTMLRVTAFRREPSLFEDHLRRFLKHTRLDAIQWVNVTRRQLTFRTLRR